MHNPNSPNRKNISLYQLRQELFERTYTILEPYKDCLARLGPNCHFSRSELDNSPSFYISPTRCVIANTVVLWGKSSWEEGNSGSDTAHSLKEEAFVLAHWLNNPLTHQLEQYILESEELCIVDSVLNTLAPAIRENVLETLSYKLDLVESSLKF
jgi:hypothetical protein